jgi:high affinity Mn2+ porin
MTVAILDVRPTLGSGGRLYAGGSGTSFPASRACLARPHRRRPVCHWRSDREGRVVCVWDSELMHSGSLERFCALVLAHSPSPSPNSDLIAEENQMGSTAILLPKQKYNCDGWNPGRLCPTAGLISLLAVSGLAHGTPNIDPAAPPTGAIPRVPQDETGDRFAFHGQITYVEQETSGFAAPYSGPNSLSPRIGRETVDITLYAGARLWSGAEFWINPEIDQGFGLDNTLGVAGFPSGEAYKVGKNKPYLRLPRVFVRQTFDLDETREAIDGTGNQLNGYRSADRLVFTVGKFGVTDLFDGNQYAHDPRGDFLNWAAVDTGSFDYAADAWGYTVGAAAEWYQGLWTLRAGVFDLSNVPNSEHLEPGFHEFQVVAELEKRHEILGLRGKLLLTVFDSRGRMGLLDEAVSLARVTGNAVDIAAVRSYRSRLGASLGLEQQLSTNLGMFARAGKASGNVESYEFTDIDRTISAGLSLKGGRWSRPNDTVALAAIVNGISAARERFLNAGGLGILVGDGQLRHPGSERIVETYYDLAVLRQAHLTLDYQWVNHPAYNLDRGPVSIVAVRLHAQF